MVEYIGLYLLGFQEVGNGVFSRQSEVQTQGIPAKKVNVIKGGPSIKLLESAAHLSFIQLVDTSFMDSPE